MTIEQRIMKHLFLEAVVEYEGSIVWQNGEITSENIDEAWQLLKDRDADRECLNNFRCSGENTGLPSQWSRHYEAKEVGRQLSDGGWIGWTFWFGGGKWGEPEAVDWIDQAYELEVTQETKIVNIYKKKE